MISKKYVLLNREVEGIADADTDALENAIDNLTKNMKVNLFGMRKFLFVTTVKSKSCR
jgi:hypothetical protein